MNVFISWSGDKSNGTANALRDWLPIALDNVKTFKSDKDINAGNQWKNELEKALDKGDFGLVCLTRENITSSWLNFEVGWLSAKKTSFAIILIDLEVKEVPDPLNNIQLTPLYAEDILKLLKSINVVNNPKMDSLILEKRFDIVWPAFEKKMGAQSMNWDQYYQAVGSLVNMIWHPSDRNDFEPDILICVNHGGAILGGLIYYMKVRTKNPPKFTSINRSSQQETIELNHILQENLLVKRDRELRILLIDDSIKSGKSLKSAVEMVQTIAKNHKCQECRVDIKTAVIVNSKSKSQKEIEPDYYLHNYISCVTFPYGPI